MAHLHTKKKLYSWHAIDRYDTAISGIYYASNALEVKQYLQSRELLPRRVRLKYHFFTPQINMQDRNRLIREMAALLSAGLPFLTMLKLLKDNYKKSSTHNIINELSKSVHGGNSLSDALCKTGLFEPIDARLIVAGEASGKLLEVFQAIIDYKAKRANLKRNIKQALVYPFTVGAISVLITLGFIFQVIPCFTALFRQNGIELPSATKKLMHGIFFLQTHGTQLLFLSVITVCSIIYAYRSQHQFKCQLHNYICKLPIIGHLAQSIALARFTSALALTCSSGLTLVNALACIEGVTGHPKYDECIPQMCAGMTQGNGLTEVMLKAGIFPDVILQGVQLGENAGCLSKMLKGLAENLNLQVDEQLNTLARMLEPCIMVGLGLWIFGLVIALYLPLFEAGGLM